MILLTESEIVSNVHAVAYLVAIITFILMGILFIFKARDKPKNIRYYIIGIILFLFLYAASRLAEFIRAVMDHTFFDDVAWWLGAIFGTVALLPLLYVLEHYILEKKTKYFFTFLTLALFIGALILNPRGSATSIGKILLYAASFPALAVPFMYFSVAIKTTGDTRKRAIGAGLGFLIAFLGIIADTALGNQLFDALLGTFIGGLTTSILFMIFVPIGMIIYYKSIRY